jgi:hypothetical protein
MARHIRKSNFKGLEWEVLIAFKPATRRIWSNEFSTPPISVNSTAGTIGLENVSVKGEFRHAKRMRLPLDEHAGDRVTREDSAGEILKFQVIIYVAH